MTTETLVGAKPRSMDLAADGGLLLVNDKGQMLRIRDGKEEWRSRDCLRLGTRPLPVGEDLVFCDKFGNLRRVDKQGDSVWGFSWRSNQRFTGESGEQTQTAGFGSTPVLSPDGKTLYVVQRQLFGDGPTPLSAFDLDGNPLWTKELPLPVDSPEHHVQVDQDGFLFVAPNYGGTIMCLDPKGETQWQFVNRSQGQLHFAVRGDTLHVATESGWVHALQRDALRKELERLQDSPEQIPTVVIQDGAVTVGGVRLKTRKP
jgi:outer membrane protein assembly factor BamB